MSGPAGTVRFISCNELHVWGDRFLALHARQSLIIRRINVQELDGQKETLGGNGIQGLGDALGDSPTQARATATGSEKYIHDVLRRLGTGPSKPGGVRNSTNEPNHPFPGMNSRFTAWPTHSRAAYAGQATPGNPPLGNAGSSID